MEEFVNKFEEFVLKYADTKVAVIIATGILAIILVVVVLSKTRFGKRTLLNLKDRVATSETNLKSYQKTIDQEVAYQNTRIEEKFKEMQTEIETLRSENRAFRKIIFKALRSINNKQVRKLITSQSELDTENKEVDKLTTDTEKVSENA